MDGKLIFISSQQSQLFEGASKGTSGRLVGTMQLTISDDKTGTKDSPETFSASDDIYFTLTAAADIGGLKPGVIKHMAPAPFSRDAETTKLVHIDLNDPSLPWRYTPQKKENGQLKPWIVLLVGTKTEIQIQGSIATVADEVFLDHDLTTSHLWAHVQSDDNDIEVARILSPRGLKGGLLSQTQYVAVLIPAFNDEGNAMWTIADGKIVRNFGQKGFLPAFHYWEFTTDEAGDFETLAEALKFPPAGDVGKAKLFYRRDVKTQHLNVNQEVEVRGAITSMQQEPEQKAALDAIAADLKLLRKNLKNTIELPDYGTPWILDPDALVNGWHATLNADARYRGIAGLGLWMGIEAQEALVDAAVNQAGALREAGQRIGNLAMGILSSGSLWNRRMPTDKNERLRILGPMMRRMLATSGGSVMDKIVANSSLNSAVFSSAAQRLIRDRSAQTRYIADSSGGINWNKALEEANRPTEVQEGFNEGFPHIELIAQKMGLTSIEKLFNIDAGALKEMWSIITEYVEKFCAGFIEKYAQLKDEKKDFYLKKGVIFFKKGFTEMLQTQLVKHGFRCSAIALIENIGNPNPGGSMIYFAQLLMNKLYKLDFYDKLWKEIYKCMGLASCNKRMSSELFFRSGNFCKDFIDLLSPPPQPENNSVDLEQLSDLVFDSLDPRRADAPVRRRVCRTLQGIDCATLVRPEFEVGLSFPTWELLKNYDLEWLLPGVNGLEKSTAVALRSNPAFIDAYMLGINTQFMSEMRWRDLAVNRTCTPLRMFWGQLNYATQQRQADIQPLAEWAKVPADQIGALSHQTILPDDALNKTGSRLILVFRSDLFRRYPSTLIYLVKCPDGEDDVALLKSPPQFEHTESGRTDRIFFGPIFMGIINPEITFFCFDVTPTELYKYWLVLDEPPTELRFRNDNPYFENKSSADFAKAELDQPTRVAINGTSLQNAAKNGNVPA